MLPAAAAVANSAIDYYYFAAVDHADSIEMTAVIDVGDAAAAAAADVASLVLAVAIEAIVAVVVYSYC